MIGGGPKSIFPFKPGYCVAFDVYILKESLCKSLFNVSTPYWVCHVVYTRYFRIIATTVFTLHVIYSHGILGVSVFIVCLFLSSLALSLCFVLPLKATTWTLKSVNHKWEIVIYKWLNIILMAWWYLSNLLWLSALMPNQVMPNQVCYKRQRWLFSSQVCH